MKEIHQNVICIILQYEIVFTSYHTHCGLQCHHLWVWYGHSCQNLNERSPGDGFIEDRGVGILRDIYNSVVHRVTLLPPIAIIFAVNIFYQQIKSPLLRMKCVFEHQYLSMFYLKLNNLWVTFTHLTLWFAVRKKLI